MNFNQSWVVEQDPASTKIVHGIKEKYEIMDCEDKQNLLIISVWEI
jgi:hypothetical protein